LSSLRQTAVLAESEGALCRNIDPDRNRDPKGYKDAPADSYPYFVGFPTSTQDEIILRMADFAFLTWNIM